MSAKWKEEKEVGSALALKVTFLLIKAFPHTLLALVAFPVSFFYYIFAHRQRKCIKRYLDNLYSVTGKRHFAYTVFLSFSLALVEKAECWGGKLRLKDFRTHDDDYKLFNDSLRKGKGAVLITSHVGSSEALRAVSDELKDANGKSGLKTLSIVDFDGTDKFNAMLKKLNPESMLNLMSINRMDSESIEEMQRTVTEGGIVIIAGDRAGGKNLEEDFLRKRASFPLGAFYIPLLIDADVYFVGAFRRKDIGIKKGYDISVRKFDMEAHPGKRSERLEAAKKMLRGYSSFLEDAVTSHPCQWFNFFDFWEDFG